MSKEEVVPLRSMVEHYWRMTETIWTTAEVAEYCGIKDTVVSNRMIRLSVPVHDREPGRAGRNRYLAHLVRAAVDAAPGKGNRTPRKPAPDA